MASELYVETLKGLTSGANANKVIIPSGQTLEIDAWSPPAGTVLQVVSSTGSSQVTIGSSSFITLSLNVSITPTSTSSKILVSVSGGEIDTSASNRAVYLSIFRNDSTNLGNSGNGFGSHWGLNSRVQIPMSMEYLDSPNTTNSTTYTVYGRTNSGTSYLNANTVKYTMTAMEIAG